jgi:hypothetical protein
VPTGGWLEPWRARDVHQDRVLVECVPDATTLAEALDGIFSLRDLDLAVCDPLARRYVLLPSIPEDLTAPHERLFDFESFLAPAGEDEETSFRVICTAWNHTTLFAFVFASSSGQWHLAASTSCSSLGTYPPHHYIRFTSFHFVGDCIYWAMPWVDKLLVLDMLRMEFSFVKSMPSGNLRQNNINTHVVASEHGTALILLLSDHDDVSGNQLHIINMNVSEPADQWKLEKITPLPRQYSYFTICADEGFLFLCGIPKEYQNSNYPWRENPFREYFVLDIIKTSELKKICGNKCYCFDARPYFGFPPSLSKPCI